MANETTFRIKRVLQLVLVFAVALMTADFALADGETTADSGSGGSAGPLSKLQVHGYLTQAYATANRIRGPFPGIAPRAAGDEISLGISEDGTFDYRFLALQFRYDVSERDVLVIQLSSRSLGESPVTELEDEIAIDWAFYERKVGDYTSVKVGRVPISFGIFNEIRDVGHILPFYRPPFVFYREGSFTNETVDGINVSHTFFNESDWQLEFDVYFGGWDSFELSNEGMAEPTRVNDSWGTQLWLNTPVPGLRFGLGYQDREVTGGLEGILREVDGSTYYNDIFFSVEGIFEKFVVRAEYRGTETERGPFPAFMVDDVVFESPNYYVQLGYNISEKFKIFAQREQSDQLFDTGLFTEAQDFTVRVDWGFALNYIFSQNVVLKLEHHLVDGEDSTLIPNFSSGFRLEPIYADLESGDYTILSLSVGF